MNASDEAGSRGRHSRVLIIMPARNEAARIAAVIREVDQRLDGAVILVVDDASTDETREVAAQAGARIACPPFHLGYGGALQTGYKFAVFNDFEFVVQMDADGQHRATDVPMLLSHVMNGECDIAIGSRFTESRDTTEPPPAYQMGTLRSIGRRTLCLFSRLAGLEIDDPTSGLQAMNRNAIDLFVSNWYPSDYPDIDVLLLAHRRGLRLKEYPVEMAPSPRPSTLHSGWLPIYYVYRMLLSLWALSAVPRLKKSTNTDA